MRLYVCVVGGVCRRVVQERKNSGASALLNRCAHACLCIRVCEESDVVPKGRQIPKEAVSLRRDIERDADISTRRIRIHLCHYKSN